MVAAEGKSDFLEQMYLAVQEEAPLWEIPRGSTDLLPSGQVVHGPWAADDCAAVLSHWFARGWLELYLPLPDHPGDRNPELPETEWFARTTTHVAPGGRFHVLAVTDARQLLAEPHRWSDAHPDGYVCLAFTSAGLRTDDEQWLAFT